MRKLLLSILIALILPSVAAAQDTYAGVSFGVAFGSGAADFPLGVQVGFGIQPDIDLRADLGYYVSAGALSIGVNGLFNFDVEMEDVAGYAGGGIRILTAGGAAAFGLGGLGGAEYMVAEDIGAFGEGGVDVLFASGNITPVFKLVAGANYHF